MMRWLSKSTRFHMSFCGQEQDSIINIQHKIAFLNTCIHNILTLISNMNNRGPSMLHGTRGLSLKGQIWWNLWQHIVIINNDNCDNQNQEEDNRSLPDMPKDGNLCSRAAWWTVSKAFLRSTYTAPVSLLLFVFILILSTNIVTACSVDL